MASYIRLEMRARRSRASGTAWIISRFIPKTFLLISSFVLVYAVGQNGLAQEHGYVRGSADVLADWDEEMTTITFRNPLDATKDTYDPLPFTLSDEFPPLESTLESVMLSNLIYSLRSCDADDLPNEDDYYNDVVWPSYLTCHSYHTKKDGTQVAIVYSEEKKYVAVVFAGTDSIPDTWIDAQVKLVPFGPKDAQLIPNNDTIKVHSGFNKQVFSEGLYSIIYDEVYELLNNHPDYNMVVTGHSLGASNSILTAVALGREFPERKILNINVAAAKCGNEDFRDYANSLDNVAIWRLVNLNDIVPRLPNLPYYKHPGHTVQFDKKGAEAYYLHYGDDDLHYAGVPWSWGDSAYLNPVTASLHHMIKHYVHYLREMSTVDPTTFYVHEFVPTGDEDAQDVAAEDGGHAVFAVATAG
jgi:hypothetical protein